MDRIRMFYSNLDTKPRILINHFSRYLGFYVEDIAENTKESDVESLIDIYIVSDAYVTQSGQSLDIKNKEKTIMIYMDGWISNEQEKIRYISYDGLNDEEFLKQLWQRMSDILSGRLNISRRLIGNLEVANQTVPQFIKLYVNNDILQMAVFSRCTPAHRDMFRMAARNYIHFIREIEELSSCFLEDKLTKYMELLAIYEIDMICKVNSYQIYKLPEVVQKKCEDLLREYADNEELHIIRADISLHLNGVWKQAGNEFLDIRLKECAYACLRRGDIQRNFVRDRDAALYEYESAVEKKGDYFIAWFQMGECAKEQMEYRKAVRAYSKVVEILKERRRNHVLAPQEIKYHFMAALEIANIYEVVFQDWEVARRYVKLSQLVRKETVSSGYFRAVWDDETALTRFFPFIEDKLNEELDEYVKQAGLEEKVYYGRRGNQN